MQLTELIKGLEKEWELTAPLPQQVPGVYTIPLEDELNFVVTTLPEGGLRLSSSISPAPQKNLEAAYQALLLSNLFGQGTKGALLGLNDAGTILTLSREIEYDVNLNEFNNIVEDFINSIDFWREEMLQYS